jgi:hypothetical protein
MVACNTNDVCHVWSPGLVAGTVTKSLDSKYDPDHRYNGDIWYDKKREE